MTIAEAINGFITGHFSTCRRSQKTQDAYKIDLAQLQTFLGPDEQLASIGPVRLEAWALALKDLGYASTSIRRKFAATRLFFDHWVRRDVLEKSPLWRLRLDLSTERVLPRNLSASDATRLVEHAWAQVQPVSVAHLSANDFRFLRLRDVAAIELLFATGIRVGELVSLRISEWREDEGSFVINGKGSRQRLAFLPDDRSRRAVDSYLERRRALDVAHDFLFVNSIGQRISTQGIARLLSLRAKSAGIEKRVTPHMIRHTVATLLLRYGADLRVVQELIGHASISTTQRYTHVSKEHLFSALRKWHPNHHLTISAPSQ